MPLKQILLAVDQLGNTLAGGWADESLSARAWREQRRALIRLIDALFFWQTDHCRSAYESERRRAQLPPAYRPD